MTKRLHKKITQDWADYIDALSSRALATGGGRHRPSSTSSRWRLETWRRASASITTGRSVVDFSLPNAFFTFQIIGGATIVLAWTMPDAGG